MLNGLALPMGTCSSQWGHSILRPRMDTSWRMSLLLTKAGWLANACLQFHGGFGFACEYDVERKFRETWLYQVAPISTNLILSYVAEHVLGLARSF